MSQAHKGSRLINIGQVKSTDLNTIFLAHYDITENDVLSGIAPLSNVTTLLPYSGKFGGGIAIEESTTNLVSATKQNFSTSTWTQYSGCVVTATQNQTVPEWGTTSATRIQTSGGGATLKYYTGIETSISGTVYTAQCLIKNIGSANAKFRTQIGNTVTVAPNNTTRAICTGTGNGTSSYQLRFETSAIADNLDVLVYQPQVEYKSFATSFVSNTRANGDLEYINVLKGLSQYTVSCWFNLRGINSTSHIPLLTSRGTSGQFFFAINPTSKKMALWAQPIGSVASEIITGSHSDIVTDTWYCTTLVVIGSSAKIFLNGVKVGETNNYDIVNNLTDANMGIACESGSGSGRILNGILDELRIDNIARTDEEVLSWYYSQSPFFPKGVYGIAY